MYFAFINIKYVIKILGITFGDEKNAIEAKGLSLYVNAVKKPWNRNYQMFSYVNEELPSIIQEHFDIKKDRQSIMGHRYINNIIHTTYNIIIHLYNYNSSCIIKKKLIM